MEGDDAKRRWRAEPWRGASPELVAGIRLMQQMCNGAAATLMTQFAEQTNRNAMRRKPAPDGPRYLFVSCFHFWLQAPVFRRFYWRTPAVPFNAIASRRKSLLAV